MERTTSGLQLLFDVWLTLIKLLTRPAVQLQLLVGAGAIVLTWLLAQYINRIVSRRYSARIQALRANILAAEQERASTHSDVAKEERPQADNRAVFDSEALERQIRARLGLRRSFYILGQALTFPLLALFVLYIVSRFFVMRDWYGGLLIDLTLLFAIFLVYRLFIGLFYVVGQHEAVERYHHLLFAPLFWVGIGLLILGALIDLETLARAPLLTIGGSAPSVGALFLASFGLYIWIMFVSLCKDISLALARHPQNGTVGSLAASLTLVQYGLIALALIGVFQLLGLNAATVAAITGGLSIGVGFALQDVLRNFIGGLIVLFEGTVRPGDWVEIAGTEGEVDRLSIRSTIVRTFDNIEYIVPNQDWLSSTVTTYTRTERSVRTRVSVGVSYDADPHFVRQLLIETVKQHPDLLGEPPPVAVLSNFGASTLDFVVLGWVEDAKINVKVAGELRYMIWDAFQEHEIEIPYNQYDVHVRSGMLPAIADSVSPSLGENSSET